MAQYLLSVHSSDGPEAAAAPRSADQMQEFMRRIGELESEMEANAVLVASGRLADAGTATVVRIESGETLMTDGPYVEAKEHLGGFYIINSADLDEALEWATKTSACVGMPIEVRPFEGLRTV